MSSVHFIIFFLYYGRFILVCGPIVLTSPHVASLNQPTILIFNVPQTYYNKI